MASLRLATLYEGWNTGIYANNTTHLPLDKMADTFADNLFKRIFLNENVRIQF